MRTEPFVRAIGQNLMDDLAMAASTRTFLELKAPGPRHEIDRMLRQSHPTVIVHIG
jgi:hypothetical protein